MRKDFHFYAIYALARAAGFPPEQAYTVAYSSQYTDDAVSEEAIGFEDDPEFRPVLTAHRLVDLQSVAERTCHRVWMPFHFLPANQGGDLPERLVTKPQGESEIAQEIIRSFLQLPPLPYSLHQLGIILHVLADTYSHQNFLGLRNRLNSISEVEIPGEADLLRKLVDLLAPNLGHAQAGSIPDIPFITWQYRTSQGELVRVANLERAMSAAEDCFVFLRRYGEVYHSFERVEGVAWESIVPAVRALLARRGELEECEEAWKTAIAQGELGFIPFGRDLALDYDYLEWYEAAVDQDWVMEGDQEFTVFEKKEGFATSNWKFFHEAAAYYRSTVFQKTCEAAGLPGIISA